MASVQASPRAGIARRARRGVRPLPLLISLTVVAALGYWAWTATHPTDDAASKAITATAAKGDLLETVSATGSVTAQTGAEVKIGSQITGTIKHLYADVGSTVKAGQIIAELNLPDIQAQLNQAQANLQAADTKYAQQQSGVGMERTQTASAIAQARAALNSAQAKLASAQAAADQQTAQTPTDIKRAQTALAVVQAALSTANSNLAQTQAGADLQVANAKEQLTQAQANAQNAEITLKRNTALFNKGFQAKSTVDDAQATVTVDQSLVQTAQQNIKLTQQKVTADLQTAHDQVTQSQENVDAARAALQAAQAEVYLDKAKLADVNDSRAAVRQAAANLKAAIANETNDILKMQDVQQAQDAVSAARAQVAYNQAEVDKTFIRSPISGTVLQLAAQQGETLAAGLSAPTLIIVADLDRLQVDAYVDETDIGKIRLGQPADITVDAFPHHVFHGKVVKIASGSTIQQGVVTYDVTVTISDPKHRLKPDMTASVTLQTGKRSNVLLVPTEAVKVGTRGSTVSVLVKKDGQTTVETRKIKTGGSDGVNTEITDGLKEGEVVVLAGLDNGNQRRGPMSPFGPSNNRGGGGGGRGGR